MRLLTHLERHTYAMAHKTQRSTCDNRGRVAGAPVVLKPATSPVPLAVAPAEIEHEAGAARGLKDGAVKEDESCVAACLPLPGLWDKVLIFPKCLQDPSVETDERRFF